MDFKRAVENHVEEIAAKSKEEKKRTLEKLLRILWAGNVTEAVLYLRNLNPSLLRASHRVTDLTGYLEKHREHIPSYALRAELGLRNSSNRVEKENDLVVAQRKSGTVWKPSPADISGVSPQVHPASFPFDIYRKKTEDDSTTVVRRG